ncbi:aquaporin family protein [Rhizobium sp. S-51]|uniref:Aquaporin family protein n=1 Tax=Rhizobium terricola TaxID=2728849 RepID=A0A7Y0FUX8_9HYPH|nr:aquaporin family protein [Rhizobium terricola]
MTARLLGEGLGTLLLLATVIGSGIMGGTLSGGNVAIALLGNTVATGAVLVVLITMLGPISGAHFNPAVTLVMLMAREISVREAVLYVLVQVFAAVAGVWLAHAMFDLDIWQVSEKVRSGGGQWLSETVATFGLVTTILLTRRFRPDHVAVSVGLYITAAYWFTASTSFANPAVTLARSVSNTFAGIRPGDVAPFVAAQLLGMLLAWIVVRALLDSVSEKS